jgi:hypothetical protein
MAKYDPLRDHLTRCTEPTLRLSFAEIERILGDVLPASARRYTAWWANEREGTHVHAHSWLDPGYETQHLDLNGATVEFVRSPRAARAR